MNQEPISTYTYKVGGHLHIDSPSYVVRQADTELYEGLKRGEFCYVLNSRQMGKTSLRVRTMYRLKAEGIACAAIDLTKIGSQDITVDQWYAGLMRRLVTSFRLPITLKTWLRDREFLPPVQRFSEFIEQVLLEFISGKIVIFIDEIDSILSLNFQSDNFFAFIRACCNEYKNLTFALLGVATPYDLIQNKNYTPFNLGYAIELNGFQIHEIQSLTEGFKGKVSHPQKVIEEVLSWTGGQPFLTQKLCQLVLQKIEEGRLNTTNYRHWIEELVQQKIIENWQAQDHPPHLTTIRDRLLRVGNRARSLLNLYQQIVQQGEIIADESSEQIELRLSGLVVKQGVGINYSAPILKVYNRIYASVFDWNWLNKALVTLQPNFQQLVVAQEHKLLSMLGVMEGKDFDDILYEILGSITQKIGELMSVDRITIFFIDKEKNELWSISARTTGSSSTKIQIFANNQTANRVTIYKKSVNNTVDLDKDWYFLVTEAQQDQNTGYQTYNEVNFPLLNEQEDTFAFVQLVNKLKQPHNPLAPFSEQIDEEGFTEADKEKFTEYAPEIQRILARCQECYQLTQRLQASEALTEATRTVSQSSLDADEIIGRVMEAAKKLMNADRTTLWLLDNNNHQLWTKIPFEDGSLRELRVNVGQGFAGKVAQTEETLNIPFDLYDHPDSTTAKKTDQQTGYRTCSLLCMPVLSPEGELLGVTQLVNKRKQGDFLPYDPADWPEAPEAFQDSFGKNSQNYMKIFNSQVGVALQNAQQFAAMKARVENHPQNVVSQTLAMLNQVMDGQGFDDILDATLRSITLRIGKSLRADRTTIFLLDEERNEFWSIIAESEGDRSLEIRIPADQGIVGEAATSKQLINIPYDFYDDSRSVIAQEQDKKNNYRTYTMVALPLFNEQGNLIAVVQSLNKLKHFYSKTASLREKIEPQGFTKEDEARFNENASLIRMILESFRSYHKTARGQRVAAALMAATRSVSQSSLELEEILRRVMDAAKELMSADRSTLWLLKREENELWTKIVFDDGDDVSIRELRVKVGEGYAGKVAQKGEILNIPFDLYDHPDSEIAKRTDQKTGYRTYSLLCLPIWNPDGELIGVTQLVNKKQPDNCLDDYPVPGNIVPDCFQISFDQSDQKYMQIFNNQVGVILQNAELLAAVKRQEETLRDNLA